MYLACATSGGRLLESAPLSSPMISTFRRSVWTWKLVRQRRKGAQLRANEKLIRPVLPFQFENCRKRGDPSSPLHLPRQLQLALQLAGVVVLFTLVQSGPKVVFASGALSMANGPALCCPLNGVGLVGSK